MWKKRKTLSAAMAAVLLFTSIVFCPQEAHAENPWDTVAGTEWMANIDSNKKITEINLPGTHDSGTQKISNATFAQCQDKSIAEQLNFGIRFLDIRLEAEDNGKLYLVHGSEDCKSNSGSKLYLEEVLSDCYSFLEAHPTETIVMSMKKDDGTQDDSVIQQYIHSYIDQNPDFWYLQNGKPVLNDARGKIVLARRYYDKNNYGDKKGGLNFLWGDQGGSDVQETPWVRVAVTGLTGLWIQDRYEYSTSDKWNAVKQGLDSPPDENKRASVYFLNFMSAAPKKLGLPTSPKSNAKEINPKFLSYELTQGKAYGWIIMDFATEELAKKVIASNNYTENPEQVEINKTKNALKIADTLTANLKLPLTGEEAGAGNGTSITWACDHPELLTILGSDVWIIRPSSTGEDVTATFTATITSGKFSQQASFTVMVEKSKGANLGDLVNTLTNAKTAYNNKNAAKIYNKTSMEALANAIAAGEKIVADEANGEIITETQAQEAVAALHTACNSLTLKTLKELEENLLGWYPLEKDSSDATKNNNHGTAKGVGFTRENGATFTGNGKLQSFISLPTKMFDGKDQMTISFWTKDDGTQASRNQAVFGFGSGTEPDGNNSPNVFKYLLINPSNNNCLKAVVTNNTWRNETGFKSTEASFPKNTWSHITCVFNGTSFTLYKDGKLVGTKDTGIRLTDFGTNRVAYIGNSIWGNNDNDYIGSVKDFRIYDGSLEAEQVAEIYDFWKSLPAEYVKQDLVTSITQELGIGSTTDANGNILLNIAKDSLTLPTTGYNNAKIVWESSHPDIIDASTGNITRPEANTPNVDVTLTAVVTLSTGESTQINFKCSVNAKQSYTVSFDSANGSDIINITVEQGKKVTPPEEPQKEGYTFDGWFATDSSTAFDFDTPITNNLLLTAKWTEIQEPDDPSDPSKPTDPSDPSKPTDPDDPSDPSKPTDPDDPSDPSKPTEPDIKDDGKGNYEVTIPELTPGQDTLVNITLSGSLADSIKNSQETQVSINVKLPEALTSDKVEAITIPKEVLAAAKEAEKELTITINGSTSYQWVFDAKDLTEIQPSDLNLALEVDSEKNAQIKDLLEEDAKGMVLSFAQEGGLANAKVTVDASKMGWNTGDAVTLSYYNPETKKLEEIHTYTIGENGKVTINAAKGGNYVLWKKTTSETTIPVEKVTLNNTRLTLLVNNTFQLEATVTPEGATDNEVTWQSENDSIATVDGNGKITANTPGTTRITATAGGQTAACSVTVELPVTKVRLNKNKLTLAPKKTYSLKATVTPTNATKKKVTWKSDNTSVATVTSKGVVKAKKTGTAKITATADGKKATCKVTVKVPVTKVTLTKTKLVMGVKETFSLKATVKPSNATNKTVSYKSSASSVVAVKNGKLTAKKKGTATITATVDGKKATCKVTVKSAPTKKTKVTLNKKKVTLKVKKTFQIKPKVSSKFGSASFQYTIDKKGKKAVKVDKNGKITAKKKGKAIITVKTYNGKAKATLKVTVK